MKKLFLFIICFTIPFFISAKSVQIDELRQCAIKAYQQRNSNIGEDFSIKKMDFFTNNGDTLMVLFHFSDNGFLMLSADDAATPVLAYSTDHSIDMDNPAPGAFYWFDLYKAQIIQIKKGNVPADNETVAAWAELRSQMPAKNGKSVVVAPLITALWDQGKYYNYYCPEDEAAGSSNDYKCPCGCVALSMGMLLYYYKYPVNPQGTAGISTNYGNFYVNLSQQTYNYDAILDEVDSYNNEIAKLLWHCGISCGMDYAPDGSGAQSSDACEALKDHFKFKSTTNLVYRSEGSSSSWITKLKNNLNNARPLYYSGYTDESAGHAFICDGYDSDNLFHFNFGWGGYGNGYYLAGDLNSGVGGFYNWQCVIVNAVPDEDPEFCSMKILTATEGTFEDGSRIDDYQNNSDCAFIIAPNDAKNFYFKIISMETEQNQDTLSFWRGNSSHGDLVTSLSGANNDGYDFMVNGIDTVYVTFKTNESVTGSGWKIYYNVTENTKNCNPYTIKTDLIGEITDGSSMDAPYDANVNCRWSIRPINANYIAIGFPYFDLSAEDLLMIYTNVNGSLVLQDTYSGSTIPEWKSYHTSQVLVEFMSDNYLQKNGFTLHWETNTEIDEFQNEELAVYPNPAKDYITIRWNNFSESNKACIYDIYGKQIYTFTLSRNNTKVNISDFSSGIYLLSIPTKEGNILKKIIKD